MSSLKKVALVSGASSDIGSILVRELLSAEFKVYAQYRSNLEALKPFEANPDLKPIRHDLSKASHCESLVQEVLKNENRLDVLINTVGPFQYKCLNEVTPEEWSDQIHFNLNLSFYLTHYAKSALIQSKGHIINFTFAGAESPKSWVNSTAYCAAKVGLSVLTKSWATLLAPNQVRVNAICPGLIEVGTSSTEERKEMSEKIPMGRPGSPDEIAQVLIWLLKNSPSYLTGASIPIAGAWEYIQ